MPATTANPPTIHRSAYYDDYDDLNSSEEEEERLLSDQHGEASEDGPSTNKNPRKRQSSNSGAANANSDDNAREDIEAANKEFESKVTRTKKPRPVLLPSHLKGSNGLVSVRRSFPSRVGKFRSNPSHVNKVLGTGARSTKYAQEMNRQAQISSAANFSRNLMSAYRDFARDIFPSLAWEDVFLKIEDLGSKKEVKDFLDIMREDTKREYLEGIYGVEKASMLLRELEFGLRQQQQQLVASEEEEQEEDYRPIGNSSTLDPNAFDSEDGEGVGVAPCAVAEEGKKGNEERIAADVIMESNCASPQLDNLDETPTLSDNLDDADKSNEESENVDEAITAKDMENEEINSSNDNANVFNADEYAELENEQGSESSYCPVQFKASAESLLETQDFSAPSFNQSNVKESGLESISQNYALKCNAQDNRLFQQCHDASVPKHTGDDTPAEENEAEGIDFHQDFTCDDRFSQVSVANEGKHNDEHDHENICPGRFSQVSAVETHSQEDEHTEDDRLSRLSVLETSSAVKPRGDSQESSNEGLSQPEIKFGASQLSMEY
eukprot:CAMPEP_0171340580 /NCGR_PEP_ID=MMETSP0878-20121228/8664_1 /TAXON_ID=67004 /ORGANISM="Thalassiosira weissflogii, Strain CCMP1336" /LENGTH=551 /DNA_ID=CAMNT_0011842679 /DNA_START=37 /DNA_END=1692 /DNA_ORIENTATION=+